MAHSNLSVWYKQANLELNWPVILDTWPLINGPLYTGLIFNIGRPSVRPASCPVHIFYILWGRNFKFGVWMHLGMTECLVPFLGHCDLDLDLWPSFLNNRVRSISLILFEVGISNLVCGCVLGWRSVAYHNWVTVTLNLTSDLVSRNSIESGAYLLYSMR